MKHFTIKELCHSDTATRRGIKNEPTEEVVRNLTALVDNVLDPLREWYGKPIYVNSGYRCPELNAAVGGVANSQHLSGEAADIDVNDTKENRKLFAWIEENCEFDQLLWENGGAWIHVSYKRSGKNRQMVRRINTR